VNGEFYVNTILKAYVKGIDKKWGRGDTITMQIDGAPSHTCNLAQVEMERLGKQRTGDKPKIVFDQQVASSPDTNALDLTIWKQLWDMVEDMHGVMDFDRPQLVRAAKRAWNQVTPETCKQAFRYKKRALAAIAKDGAHFN
jgi:hypothetical protein